MIYLDVSSSPFKFKLDYTDRGVEEAFVRKILTKRAEGCYFMPKYKNGSWDGKVSFLEANSCVKLGLIGYLTKQLETNGFNYELSPKLIEYQKPPFSDIDYKKFKMFWVGYFKGSKYTPREYQIKAAHNIMMNKQSLSDIATGAGKTLIIFMITYLMKLKGYNSLIILPSQQLIDQTLADFKDYLETDKRNVDFSYDILSEGKKDIVKGHIGVGTFHTIRSIDSESLKNYQVICCDEVHRAKCKSIKDILNNIPHFSLLYGMSGTLNMDFSEDFEIMSIFGDIKNVVKTKELQNKGIIPKTKVTQLINNWSDEDIAKAFELVDFTPELLHVAKYIKRYNMEDKLSTVSPDRMLKLLNVVLEDCKRDKSNSLILFKNLQYGAALYNNLDKVIANVNKALGKDVFKVYFVDGDVNPSERTRIKVEMDDVTSPSIKIVVASYGTFSLGVSINNLFRIYLFQSLKGENIIKQSIGRGLRNFKNKEHIKIIDIVDNINIAKYLNPFFNKSDRNCILYKQAASRRSIYKKEGFDIATEELRTL